MVSTPPPLLPPGSPLVEVVAGRGGPVLLSVPHSGRDYPAALIARSRVGRLSLEPLEDPWVDRLVIGALDRGAGAVIARAPRALIDVNRAEDDLHPVAIRGRTGEPSTPRARAGLGVIPTRLAGIGDLWRAPIDEAELQHRLVVIHRPYHDAITEGLQAIRRYHEDVLLLDCHSMPPRPQGQANVVIGDRHGTTSGQWLVEAAGRLATELGFAVAYNNPFAGGHIIERHADPAHGVHAIQIEIDRGAYCQRDARTPGHGFDRVARLFEILAGELGAMLDRRFTEAAQ